MNRSIVSRLIVVTLGLTACQALLAAEPDRRFLTAEPSVSTDGKTVNGKQRIQVDIESRLRWGFRCYSYRNGKPADCFLRSHVLGTVDEAVAMGIIGEECMIDATGSVIPFSCADGGHRHQRNPAERPRLRIFDKNDHDFTIDQDPTTQQQLEFTSFDQSPFERFKVSGELPSLAWSYISGPAPDNAGSFYFKMEVEPPECFFLPLFCGFRGRGAQPDGTYLADGVLSVRFEGLQRLDDEPTLYRKVRGVEDEAAGDTDDLRHPNAVAFFGTPRTLAAMRLLALEYKTATGNRLQPNDMSLPFGGLFDVLAAYNYEPGGHRSHRDGQDIDFNTRVQLPSGGSSSPVRCEVDKDFHEAVHKVLAPYWGRATRTGAQIKGQGGTVINPETAVLCESGGRKHVDVTQIISIAPFAR